MVRSGSDPAIQKSAATRYQSVGTTIPSGTTISSPR
jgi:hypothetical protein